MNTDFVSFKVNPFFVKSFSVLLNKLKLMYYFHK